MPPSMALSACGRRTQTTGSSVHRLYTSYPLQDSQETQAVRPRPRSHNDVKYLLHRSPLLSLPHVWNSLHWSVHKYTKGEPFCQKQNRHLHPAAPLDHLPLGSDVGVLRIATCMTGHVISSRLRNRGSDSSTYSSLRYKKRETPWEGNGTEGEEDEAGRRRSSKRGALWTQCIAMRLVRRSCQRRTSCLPCATH